MSSWMFVSIGNNHNYHENKQIKTTFFRFNNSNDLIRYIFVFLSLYYRQFSASL